MKTGSWRELGHVHVRLARDAVFLYGVREHKPTANNTVDFIKGVVFMYGILHMHAYITEPSCKWK
jgi:hypothetical protein